MDPNRFRELLSNHQKHAHVKVHDHGHAVRVVAYDQNGKISGTMQGLTGRLRDCFFPNDPKRFSRYRKKALGLIGGSSTRDGTMVHAWIRHRINCSSKRTCNCPRRPKGEPPVYVQRFFTDLQTLGFVPLQAEVPVWDKKKNLMTLIDVIVKTPKNTLAVLEIKTGFNGSIDMATRTPKARYLCSKAFSAKIPANLNTFRHKHFLQVLIGAMLFNGCYKRATGISAEEAWVVYLNNTIKEGAYRPQETTTSWIPAHMVEWTSSPLKMAEIFMSV